MGTFLSSPPAPTGISQPPKPPDQIKPVCISEGKPQLKHRSQNHRFPSSPAGDPHPIFCLPAPQKSSPALPWEEFHILGSANKAEGSSSSRRPCLMHHGPKLGCFGQKMAPPAPEPSPWLCTSPFPSSPFPSSPSPFPKWGSPWKPLPRELLLHHAAFWVPHPQPVPIHPSLPPVTAHPRDLPITQLHTKPQHHHTWPHPYGGKPSRCSKQPSNPCFPNN